MHGAFLVYDTTKRASFENAEKWFQEIRNYSKQYGGSDPIVLLVGNKTDLESLREVTSEEAEMFAGENHEKYISSDRRTSLPSYAVHQHLT